MVYIILGTGFEEMEAIVPCDMLRRAGVETKLVGIGGTEIRGSRGITVKADCTESQVDWKQGEMIVLPGGLGGVESILASQTVMDGVKAYWDGGKYVAAICAAPTVLARLGITDGKKACCYPGMEEEMGQAQMRDCDSITDGKVITGRAAGGAYAFALSLITVLVGKEKADSVAEEIVLSRREG